jgi:hypothetical protein
MSDEQEDFKKKLDALKPKKKKLSVPEEFLDGAKSYESKLEAIKIITEREKDRVVLMFKGMLKPELPKTVELYKEEKTPAKPAEKPKKFLGKK